MSLVAQTVQLQTFINDPVTYTFLSRTFPALSAEPDHGEVTFAAGDILYEYTLTYTPDSIPGEPPFEGEDDFKIFTFPLELNTFAITTIEVSVVRAEVLARRDMVSTTAGESVAIDVTANDSSSTGTILLRTVTVTNAGTTEIVGDDIVFTPFEGFIGLTDFDYVICTENDACTTGTVSVNVLTEGLTTTEDTLHIFTKREVPQIILIPSSYTLSTNPDDITGTYDPNTNIPTYTPADGFVGTEYLDFEGPGGSNKVFQVEVLNMTDEGFTQEDIAYTLTGNSVYLNVVENDTYGGFTGCLDYPEVTENGGSIATTSFTGRIIYTPPSGDWTGIDRFTYTAYEPGCIGEPEVQTVYVVVSDFAPEFEEITITTASSTTIPLTYNTPTGEIRWSVAQDANLGAISEADDGQLYYTPPANGGVDELSLTYCLLDSEGECLLSKTVAVTLIINDPTADSAECGDDCVWPGDTNHDGMVDMADFLTLGLHMGQTGTPRLTADPAMWCPQEAEDWGEDFNGVDLKHVDANGDQIISSADTSVVTDHLGYVNRLRPIPSSRASFDVYLEGDIIASPGDLVPVDIVVGSRVFGGTQDIIGFIFPFDYDPNVIIPSSVVVQFDEGSWMSYDSPVISTQQNNETEGSLVSAYVRTNRKPISGYGRVGTMLIGTQDIIGFRESIDQEITTTIGGQYAEAMGASGDLSAVYVHPFELTIRNTQGELDPGFDTDIDQYLSDKLLTFPNPAGEQLTVHLNGQREFTEVMLTDFTGRRVYHRTNLATNHQLINLSQIPTGIYSLNVTTAEGVINRKIEVIH